MPLKMQCNGCQKLADVLTADAILPGWLRVSEQLGGNSTTLRPGTFDYCDHCSTLVRGYLRSDLRPGVPTPLPKAFASDGEGSAKPTKARGKK